MESTSVDIEGVKVLFPYKPYDIQLDYMKSVIKCLQQKTNGLLESPTGTGKTVCILCSTLGWLDTQRLNSAKQMVDKSLMNAEDRPAMSLNGWQLSDNSPKVIYSSRTHSQLSQACKELKRTAYKTYKSVVIGSRDQLCLNEEVTKLETISAKNQMCRLKVANNSCHYYRNYEQKVEKSQDYNSTQVFDIEDLVKIGRKNTCCPYYSSRYLVQKASLVFSPYNYVLDPRIRQSNALDLKNSVIIFDEGHNIERMCEESVSSELRSETFAICIKHIDSVLVILKEIKEGTYMGDNTKEYSELDIGSVAKLKLMVCDLESAIDSLIKESPQMKALHETSAIFGIIDKIGLEVTQCMDWFPIIEKISLILLNSSSLNASQSTTVTTAFTSLAQFIEKMMPMKLTTLKEYQSYKSEFIQKFKIFSERGAESDDKSFWNKKSDPNSWVLHIWCMSPSVGAKALLDLGIHSMVITSGTLAPINSFEMEMSLNFPVKLQNSHIIGENQLSIINISKARDNTILTSKYDNRDNLHYIRALGLTLIELMRAVPKGALVFFSSYTSLNKCTTVWKSSEYNIWGKLNAVKQIFLEPRSKQSFNDCIAKYKLKIDEQNSNGAVFFGVCRGKLSEGIDLPDDYCRCVVMTGLPFPAVADPRVMLKKQYLTEANAKLTANGWYTLQMKRALNQSIGRVVRHKDDFGVILLLDSRFAALNDGLSKWVEKFIFKSSFKNLDQSIDKIKTFFSSNTKHRDSDHFISVNKTNSQKILPNETNLSQKSIEFKDLSSSLKSVTNGFINAKTIINEFKSNENPIVINSKSIFDTMSSVITSSQKEMKTIESNESPLKRPKLSSLKAITPSVGAAVETESKLQSIMRNRSNSSSKKVRWNEDHNRIHEFKPTVLNFTEEVNESKDNDITEISKSEENPQSSGSSKKSNEEVLDFWRKCGAELKEMFKGSNKFNQLCQSVKTYKKYKNLRLLAMSFVGVFEKFDENKRNYFIRELSRIVPKSDYYPFLRLCDIKLTDEELAQNKEFKPVNRGLKSNTKST